MKNCLFFITLLFSVIALGQTPTADFTMSDTDGQICLGNCISFINTSSNNGLSFQWTFEGGTPNFYSGFNPGSVCFNSNGTFSITLTVTNTFGSNSTAQSIVVLPYTDPIVNLDFNGNNTYCIYDTTLLLSGGTPIGGFYTGNGTANNSFTPSTAGLGFHNITYSYTDNNGCTGYSMDSILVENCASIGTIFQDEILIFPNPNNGFFSLIGEALVKYENLEIIDVFGKKIGVWAIESTKMDFSLTNMERGIYFLNLISDNIETKLKIQILK